MPSDRDSMRDETASIEPAASPSAASPSTASPAASPSVATPSAAASTQSAALARGVELPSRFEVVKALGSGAMGSVVQARDRTLGRDVAVKIISEQRLGDARSRDRFVREARAAAALKHEHIVAVHDLDPRGRFIVMELVRGDTLRQRISREGALPVDEVRRIALALLDALATAHDAGIVHRDVKPANVLLGEPRAIVKLTDFGIAATSDSELTRTGEVIGTPAYMAPEQLRGQTSDERVDIYATGATLFEALTGQRLHLDGASRVHGEHGVAAGDRLPPLSRMLAVTPDRSLAQAIARAVRDAPDERFPTARAFAEAISGGGQRKRFRTIGIAGAVAIAVAVAIAIVVGLVATPSRTEEPPGRPNAAMAADANAHAVSKTGNGADFEVGSRAGSSHTGSGSPDPLERGMAALERAELATAERELRIATQVPGASAKAHYALGILYWWTSRATNDVVAELDKAIAGGIDARLADVARGVRSLVKLEYPGVIEAFEQLRSRYPHDRDVLYGSFEALFHGGRPAEAMAIYDELRTVAPAFGLGRHHALHYRLARKQLDAARAALQGATGLEQIRWTARIDAAGGTYETVVAGLSRARTSMPDHADALGWEIVALHAAHGQIGPARELAMSLAARDVKGAAVPLLAFALARGTDTGTDAAEYLWKIAIGAADVPPSITASARDGWVELATILAITGDRERARTALARLPREDETKIIDAALARVHLQGVVKDRAALAAFANASPFPDVRATAEALLASLGGDAPRAAAAWQRALDSDGAGRFRIAATIQLARARDKLADHEGAIAACEYVISPPLFQWAWGAGVAECLAITARGHHRAKHLEPAARFANRLLELRAAAPPDDKFAALARSISADRTRP